MRRTIATLALVAAMAGTAMAGEPAKWEIESLYRSSTNYIRAVVVTDKTIRIQCAATDKDGKALAVSSTVTINPPMDEVIIRAGSEAKSAECWTR